MDTTNPAKLLGAIDTCVEKSRGLNSRHRVMPACSHRATPPQTLNAKPDTFSHTVPGNGLVGVVRTGRHMAAITPQIRRQGQLIKSNSSKRQLPHHSTSLEQACVGGATSTPARLSRPVMERFSLWYSAEEASFRAIRTISQPC